MPTFQEQLDALRSDGVPLPLMPGQQVPQALRLRKRGLSYGAISAVMAIYHGDVRSEAAWRRVCRRAGAPIKVEMRRPPVRA